MLARYRTLILTMKSSWALLLLLLQRQLQRLPPLSCSSSSWVVQGLPYDCYLLLITVRRPGGNAA